jgi:putative transposase
MQNNTAIPFPPSQFTAEAPLTEVLRQGAQRLLAQAIEVEVAMLLARYADHRDSEGRQALVRNGYLPERDVQTGIGAVRVKVPRVRDCKQLQGSLSRKSCVPIRRAMDYVPW